jgi:hypothetical protein
VNGGLKISAKPLGGHINGGLRFEAFEHRRLRTCKESGYGTVGITSHGCAKQAGDGDSTTARFLSERSERMKFAKRVFLIAGIYGLIVVLPMYLLEDQNGKRFSTCDYPPGILLRFHRRDRGVANSLHYSFERPNSLPTHDDSSNPGEGFFRGSDHSSLLAGARLHFHSGGGAGRLVLGRSVCNVIFEDK